MYLRTARRRFAGAERGYVSNAGRRLGAAFTTTTAPVDPDSVQVDDDDDDTRDRVCFPAVGVVVVAWPLCRLR